MLIYQVSHHAMPDPLDKGYRWLTNNQDFWGQKIFFRVKIVGDKKDATAILGADKNSIWREGSVEEKTINTGKDFTVNPIPKRKTDMRKSGTMKNIGSKILKETDAETETKKKRERGKAERKDRETKKDCGLPTVIRLLMEKAPERLEIQKKRRKSLKVKNRLMKKIRRGRKAKRSIENEKVRRTERDIGTTVIKLKAKVKKMQAVF